MNSIIKYKKVDHNYNIRNVIVYGSNVKYYLALRLQRRHLITDPMSPIQRMIRQNFYVCVFA